MKSELDNGHPYTIAHAAAVAEAVSSLIHDRSPKKGLITDLDDTLWGGILGEVGAANVCWDLDRRAQAHGLYQQLLGALASAGVLIGVASKNDPAHVEEAFARRDLLLRADAVYPLEVSWGRKASAVGRILDTWNIAPDAVVFVDDSRLELADVGAAYPEIECILFPNDDPQAVWDFLTRLRDLFGKRSASAEDALRLGSIRAAATLREIADEQDSLPDEFLRSAKGSIVFAHDSEDDPRAFELINKTNQFNLNGKRLTEAEWSAALDDPASFLVTVSYED